MTAIKELLHSSARSAYASLLSARLLHTLLLDGKIFWINDIVAMRAMLAEMITALTDKATEIEKLTKPGFHPTFI